MFDIRTVPETVKMAITFHDNLLTCEKKSLSYKKFKFIVMKSRNVSHRTEILIIDIKLPKIIFIALRAS